MRRESLPIGTDRVAVPQQPAQSDERRLPDETTRVHPVHGVQPRLLVLSSLFPSAAEPHAGLFVRERVFRVGQTLPVVVLAPQPWFPFQSLIQLFKKHFRPAVARYELQQGFEIHRPRFLCFPGVLKRTDGLLMALSVYPFARMLVRRHRLNGIDAHFGYPDGYAATLLGRWLRLPVMITLRGKEEGQMALPVRKPLVAAIRSADRIVCVSTRLAELAAEAGADRGRIAVIGNGVDLSKFQPVPRDEARQALQLPTNAKVLVSVGRLVERKGFHRVIECLPALRNRFPDLHYLIVGGGGPHGDVSKQLERQVATLGLHRHVHFLGEVQPDLLKAVYSAGDVFVLATAYEGWANVFLEAMACGLPVVTTRVGGNAEVVRSPDLGCVTELGDHRGLTAAIEHALSRAWDRALIMRYARSNGWETRIPAVVDQLAELVLGDGGPVAQKGARRLKILYHHRVRSRDGQAVHIEEMIAAFREAGAQVIVVEPPGFSSSAFGVQSRSLNFMRQHVPRALYELMELGYSLLAYMRLRRAYLSHRPDILYERHNLHLLAGLWLRKRFGIPYLLEVNAPMYRERMEHGGLALAGLAHWTERAAWRAADLVLPVTEVLAAHIRDEGVPKERIAVVPNGINPDAFARAPSTAEAKRALGLQGELVLGFTGFVRSWHGLAQVIDLIAKSSRRYFLLVVGDGPAREELEAQARRLGVAERVRFTGVVDRARVPDYIAAFDIALQPAGTAYASPLKVFEYMFMGRAVVAPRQPNICEVLRHGENGLLFDPACAEDLARTIDRLAVDPAERARIAEAGQRTIVEGDYTWACNARRVVGIAQTTLVGTAASARS